MKCRNCHEEIPDESRFCLHCGSKQNLSQKPKNRGNGQGSVYQLHNKRWIAVKTIGYRLDADGVMRRMTRSKSGFKTKKDALDYLPKLGTDPVTKSITFRALYEKWYPTHEAGKSTLGCYRAAMKHFRAIEFMKVEDITIDDLQECIDDCAGGKRTRENMKALCGLLYKYAIPRKLATMNLGQYIVMRNVSDDVGKKTGLPDCAVEKLEENAGIVKGADYILCQCYLGFRPTEFLELDAKDYNRKERAFVGGAKTEAGRDRVVTVSPKIQPIIDRLIADKIAGPVFCGDDGKRMTIRAYRSMFYDALEACGIDNPTIEAAGVTRKTYTPHSCRHTFATLMKRVSGSDKDKLALIGHSSAEMLRHYQDVSYEDLRKITDAI